VRLLLKAIVTIRGYKPSKDLIMKYLFVFLLLCISLFVKGQKITIVDASSKSPIPYATVVLRGGEYGFVANDSGQVNMYNLRSSDILEFRSIGYISRKLICKDIITGDSVLLQSSALELDEIIVKPMPADEYVRLALKSISKNYYPDSFATHHYYKEYLKENNHYVNYSEAFLEAIQTGYLSPKDSFDFRIRAGHKSGKDELEFMLKEREKEIKKELKSAKKNGQEATSEDFVMPLEIGNPPFLLSLDPLRNADQTFVVNNDNVDFLDSATHTQYEFWYGKPVEYGDQSLVVVHFDQKKKVHKPMLAGTMWIEQSTNAFVKIEFGISDYGQNHIIPGYMKAALWIYGLSFDIKNTLVEFNYQPFKGKWALGGVRLKADVFLEKRRLFSENEAADFVYECEMLTTELHSYPYTFKSNLAYDYKKLISEQLPETPEKEWQTLKQESRTYR